MTGGRARPSAAAAAPRAPISASSTPTSADTGTHKRVRKQCSATGCVKVDAGGGFCVSHGGGKKCSFPGCIKGYQTGGFCRKHGGGARCQVPGCSKVDAGKGLCRAHGGGRRCQAASCSKADVGGGFCTAHGGGKRCTEPGCEKIDQGGGKCRAHGGAKRCRRAECTQTARGANGLCPDHGGAKICAVPNCRRLARGGDGLLCLACTKERAGGVAAGPAAKPKLRDERRSSPTATPTVAKRRRVSKRSVSPTSSDDEAASSSSDAEERKPAVVAVTPPMEPVTRAVYSPLLPPLTALPVPPLSVAAREPGERGGASAKCDGSYVASCLENGCARSYGGDCSCGLACSCNSQAERDAGAVDAPPPPGVKDEPFAAVALGRYVVHIKDHGAHAPPLALSAILAVVAAAEGIRSVHDITSSTASPVAAETTTLSEGNGVDDCSGDAKQNKNLLHVIAIRSDKALDVAAALAPLNRLGVRWFVAEQGEVQWTRAEVVLRVPAMMCPGNCGKSVVNAVRAVPHVESVSLVFASRQVVARGRMSAEALSTAVSAIGFEPHVDAVTPLASRFRFRVQELADEAFAGRRLERALRQVEGVESVVVYAELAEVLVVAMVETASPLMQAASRHGIEMAEAPDAPSSTTTWVHDPFDSLPLHSAASSAAQSTPLEASDGRHLCDINTCPHNGCEQYRATVAHTAALAVGWSVPGCAMTWGGECTCGEACKCSGCPTHNPVS